MQIFIFIFYLVLSFLFFQYYQFEKNTGLSIGILFFLFVCKVFFGTINLYIHFYAVVTNDVGFFHWQAVNELKVMHQDPAHFFYEWLFNWGHIRDSLDFSSPKCNIFWKDLGVLFHTKYMTLANILSLGNQYVNVIIYNIPFFTGQLLLYKVFYRLQPEKKWLYVVVIFLIPSVLFWCSGIHKDGWILMAFGCIIYASDSYLRYRKLKYLMLLILSLFFLFIVRYFYFIAFLPLVLLWSYTYSRKYKIVYFFAAFVLTAVVFFNINKLFPQINPMQQIQNRQNEFLSYIGYSDMKTPKLENNISSYIRNLPTALNHVFLQPVFKSDAPIKYKISFIDNMVILIFITVFIISFKRKNFSNSIYIALLCYAVSMYIFIGYTIPNCGALVRYKSEFTVLLLASLAGLSEMPLLNAFLNKKLFSSE